MFKKYRSRKMLSAPDLYQMIKSSQKEIDNIRAELGVGRLLTDTRNFLYGEEGDITHNFAIQIYP